MTDYVALLKAARAHVKASVLYKRFISGTPLENDIAVWMADFASEADPIRQVIAQQIAALRRLPRYWQPIANAVGTFPVVARADVERVADELEAALAAGPRPQADIELRDRLKVFRDAVVHLPRHMRDIGGTLDYISLSEVLIAFHQIEEHLLDTPPAPPAVIPPSRFPDHINRDGSGVWIDRPEAPAVIREAPMDYNNLRASFQMLESDLHAENERLRADLADATARLESREEAWTESLAMVRERHRSSLSGVITEMEKHVQRWPDADVNVTNWLATLKRLQGAP